MRMAPAPRQRPYRAGPASLVLLSTLPLEAGRAVKPILCLKKVALP